MQYESLTFYIKLPCLRNSSYEYTGFAALTIMCSLRIWKLKNQGVTKRCRLSWLTNSDLVYEPKCEGAGGCGVSANEYTAVHRSPKKLWRSNSIFNLCVINKYYGNFPCILGNLQVIECQGKMRK
jgi:hypothetical protein